MQKGNTTLQLFNLDNDSKELNNIAGQHPDVVNQILGIMKKEHRKSAFSRFNIKAIDN